MVTADSSGTFLVYFSPRPGPIRLRSGYVKWPKNTPVRLGKSNACTEIQRFSLCFQCRYRVPSSAPYETEDTLLREKWRSDPIPMRQSQLQVAHTALILPGKRQSHTPLPP